jgi:spore germination cell wall hydrolase CwlJ-like protein
MYFHTAGRWYPYSNMHYVLVAGGNAFYEKRSRYATWQTRWNPPPPPVLTPVAERATIDTADRVRLATFLSTGRGM